MSVVGLIVHEGRGAAVDAAAMLGEALRAEDVAVVAAGDAGAEPLDLVVTVGGDGTFGHTATGPYSFSQSPSITTSSGNGTTTPTYTVIGNSGSYSVTESANANFTLTSVSCSDGVNTLSNTSFTVPAGKTVTCTFTNTNKTRALFTDTLLCTFDVDSGSLGTQFHLIYTPDNTNHSV